MYELCEICEKSFAPIVAMENTGSFVRKAQPLARGSWHAASLHRISDYCVKAALSRQRSAWGLSKPLRHIMALLYMSILFAFVPARSETVAVEVGYGQDVRVQSLEFDFDCPTCRLAAPEHTSLAWEFAAQAMQGHRPNEANDNLFALGAMPLVRYSWPERNGGIFVEDGVGVHLVSHTRLYNERELSTAFQFGELLGVGLRFCGRNICEAGIRLQHMSNANIKRPNDGVTFPAIRFAVRWN